jgi:hypothetical protein
MIPQADLMAPDWVNWDGDEDPNTPGVGDSVYFDREHAGTAFLGEGESIIPGVPMPDMSGENYQ